MTAPASSIYIDAVRKLLPIVLVLFACNAFGEDIQIGTPDLSELILEAEAADLRKKAEAGDAAAQTNLGIKYAKGEGVPQDSKEAVKWLRKAAEQGDARAQYGLGLSYELGRGVLKDSVSAYAWFSLAAYNGSEHGAQDLDRSAVVMTAAQIAKAQELSKELLKKIEANKAKKK